MAEWTPEEHRTRLRSMLDPDHPARELSPADRAAIRWALAEIDRLKAERDAACRLERERWERLPAWARAGKPGKPPNPREL